MPVLAKYTFSQKEVIEDLKKPIRKMYDGNEKDFEKMVLKHIPELCEGLSLPEPYVVVNQKLVNFEGFHIKPDIMVRHKDDTMTIFEIKKTNEKFPCTGATNQLNAVGQLFLYGNMISSKIGNKVRLALIDNKIYYRTYCAFMNYDLPIALIEFQKNRVLVPYNGWSYG